MIRGIGASRTGMAWEQSRSEVIADNVANVNTDGFKRSVAVGTEFAKMVVDRLGDRHPAQAPASRVGPLGNGAALDQITPDSTQGGLRATGNSLDIALTGSGEFVFQGPSGPGFTRNGSFRQNAAGQLVTALGYPVLVNGAPVGGPNQDIRIDEQAVVYVNGAAAGRLDIRGGAATNVAVGQLETSNVDLAQEMTDMITALRSFQANQRALQMQDQTLERAVTEIGKV